MAFSGGVFSLLYNWVTDRDNNQPIDATKMQAENQGLADGLSNTITRDGQSTITSNIPFNGQRITGLGNASAATDAMNRQSSDGRYLKILGGAGTVVSVAASTVDLSTGTYFTKTVSGPLSWVFTNPPASGAFGFTLQLFDGGAGEQTWPASVRWPNGSPPVLTDDGTDVLVFVTIDGGSVYRGALAMRDSA